MTKHYQELDQDQFDYGLIHLNPPKGPWIRGPLIDWNRDFIACVGAAQTFGRYTERPFPNILADRFSTQAFNLSKGGAGPRFFDRPELLEWVNGARLVVMQVLSARSASNSLFDNGESGTPAGRRRDDGRAMRFEAFFAEVVASRNPSVVESIVEETREDYLKSMVQLLNNIKPPKILLWIGPRNPDAEDDFTGPNAKVGPFPQLVNRAMVTEMRRHCDAYLEYRSTPGLPQKLRPADKPVKGSKLENGFLVNRYYPSPEMHREVGHLLVKNCQSLWDTTAAKKATRQKKKNPVVNYVLLSTERSGTGLLLSLLRSHPAIVSAGEIFNPQLMKKGVVPWHDHTVSHDPELVDLWRRDPMALYERLIKSAQGPLARAVGFKLFYNQVTAFPEILQHIVGISDFRVIHLKRRNLLRRHLSNVRALDTGVWWARSDDQRRIDFPPLELDASECRRNFQRIQECWAHYDDVFRNHRMLEIFYEDLAADPLAVGTRAVEFLGLDAHQNIKVGTRKTGTGSLRDAIANYDALKSELTEYLSFFDDDRTDD